MRGASQALSAPESRALARTFYPEGEGGARRPGPWGSEEGLLSVGSGPGGLASKPPLSERFSSRLYSFICPAVIRWAGPLREQRLKTLKGGFLSTSLTACGIGLYLFWLLQGEICNPRGGWVSREFVNLLKLYLRKLRSFNGVKPYFLFSHVSHIKLDEKRWGFWITYSSHKDLGN